MTRLGHPVRGSISNSLGRGGLCVEGLAETFYSRLSCCNQLLWRSRNRFLQSKSPYLGTDAGSRKACTTQPAKAALAPRASRASLRGEPWGDVFGSWSCCLASRRNVENFGLWRLRWRPYRWAYRNRRL